MRKNIILIGFMGVGKTTYGKRLSQIWDMLFVDTDRQIEEEEGMDIASIFDKKGESYFREKEEKIVADISGRNNLIIATGGGIVKTEKNMELLKKNGIIVYLKAAPEKIFENLKDDNTRPLLLGDDKFNTIEKLLNERVTLYEKQCDIAFDVSVGDEDHITKCLVDSLEGML